MLQHLSIQNYALINSLEVDFAEELNIITGETGAGKSILLGALSLVLGDRADLQSLNDKTKKCVIEALFNISSYKLKNFFKENELDYEDKTTIRREINPEGKSRAFINDTPVTLSVLKELGEKLIDIHSQHETLALNDGKFQLSVVDAFAKNQKYLTEYSEKYSEYKKTEKGLNDLVLKESESKKELDYFTFLFNELEEIGLKEGEQEILENELETLNNAEEIKLGLSSAFKSLSGGEVNLLSSLNEVKLALANLSKYNSSIKELADRINSSYIELKDISSEIENIEESIEYNPTQIEEVTQRLDEIYRLQQKHRVNTIAELIAIKDDLSNKLQGISTLEKQIVELKNKFEKLEKELFVSAEKISKIRAEKIPAIEKEVKEILASLSMNNANLKIEQNQFEELTETGIDKIKFLFSANKGADFKELNKVASGGELSRLMLAIKSIIAKLTSLPSVIFDEIDTGVSGDVAAKVGIIMENMAQGMQVISITHLPQIASRGKNHFFVYKTEEKGKTNTHIKKLTAEERIQEIAKMLSTDKPTDAALKNAKELLKN